ncbi:MAG TPA: glycosyltransferase family 39 protein, partial [Candidatus Binatus sp.]|nr:glycosyltransferase family 39 protein [Candidatus Binatus sp.]
MPRALVPPAVLLVCWLPGWAAARWCLARTGRPLAPVWLSPFPEILLGLCLWSWVGFLLAELGVFSPFRVGAALIGVSLILVRGAPAVGRPGWRSPLAGLAIALLAGTLYSPPYETIVMASDATIYFNTGVHLGRAGSISVPDPLLGELGFAARAALLPLGPTVGWTRLPGALLVRSGEAEVMWPTYFHVLPVWIATFERLGGLAAGGLVGTMFAVLALWAVFLLAHELLGVAGACVTTAFLLTSVAELFYARFLMPEVLTQLFLCGGLLCFVVWWRHEWPSAGALAAAALGIAGLTRVEYLFLVPLALLLQLVLVPRRPRGTWLFAGLYLALLAHGLAHLALVPTHYREVVTEEVAHLWSSLPALDARTTARTVAPVAAIVAAVVVVTRGGWRPGLALALAGTWAMALFARSESQLAPALSWLAETAPWPVLALACLGLG